MTFDIALTPQMMGVTLYAGAILLILIGLFAMIARDNVFRMLLGLGLAESGINLFLIAVGFRPDAVAPIQTGVPMGTPMVDPLPQALVLTAIVIGAGVLALAAALIIRVKEGYNTLDASVLAQELNADPQPGTMPATKQGTEV